MKRSLVIILFLILIFSCNKKKDEIIKQYKNSFNKSEETKAENKILTKDSFIKRITALGSNFITFDLEKNIYSEDFKNVLGINEFIGFHNDNYIFTVSEDDSFIIKEIDSGFSKSRIIGKVKLGNSNSSSLNKNSFYFLSDGKLSIFNLDDFKEIYNLNFGEILFNIQLVEDKLIYLTEGSKLVIKNLKGSANEVTLEEKIDSFYCTEKGIYYLTSEHNLYLYDFLGKKKDSLNFQIPYTNKDKIVSPIKLVFLDDNKLFYVTRHYNWTMPYEIMHYYDFKEKKVVDLVEYIGLFSNYKIDFK